MKPKLLELSEILKQKPEIKERLESYVYHYECYGLLIWFHDVLEYLGEDYSLWGLYIVKMILPEKEEDNLSTEWLVDLSPWPLSDQTDETLDEIISLSKNVWKN